MNQLIQQLLELVQRGDQAEKLSCLMDIGDYIDFKHPDTEESLAIVQRLIDLASKETDKKVRGRLLVNVSKAYTQRVDLSDISFEPLISILDKQDSTFICDVIYLLSMTYKEKYIPVITEYISHPDENVRNEAISALDFLKR